MNKRIANFVALIALLFFFGGTVQAQLLPKPKTPPKATQSDPEATKLLKQLQAKYEKFTGIYSDYILIIDNRETKEKQNGKITQKGDKFHVENDGNQIFCDGVTLWMYMKKNNEVQINEYSKDEDPMSPNRILKIYEAQDEFLYAITNDYGNKVDIEFKPLDRDATFKFDKAKFPGVKEVDMR